MKILFVSRAYPPIVGGIENQNGAIGHWLTEAADCKIIANPKGKRWLPLFLPWAIVCGLWLARNVDAILLGDGVVAVVGWFLKWFYPRKRVVCIVHGLDITYPNALYQRLWVKQFFYSIDHFVGVSRSTADIAMDAGVNRRQITVIPNGVDMPFKLRGDVKKLSALLNIDVSERSLLVTVGRLVRRKGVVWFIRNVLPRLPEECIYVISGDGPEHREIVSLIGSDEYADRVFCLGMIDEDTKALLLSTCDLFVQPNIDIPGDVEGFGITVIEAGSYGLPVLVADLQGLKDSVQEDHNGWRVPSGDADAFSKAVIHRIEQKRGDPDLPCRIREYVRQRYSYEVIVQQYLEVLATNDGSG